jgi:hypothetical protein
MNYQKLFNIHNPQPRSPRPLSRLRKFGQRDEWKGCSPTAIKMAEKRSNDDTPFTPDPFSVL